MSDFPYRLIALVCDEKTASRRQLIYWLRSLADRLEANLK